jgi:CxxC motif-containing protein (DUF1111 family)
MHYLFTLLILLIFAWPNSSFAADTIKRIDFSKPEVNEERPGGNHTHRFQANRDSFLHPSPALDLDERLNFRVGQAIFEKIWVFATSSTTASDGLGPLYNARSCHRCHSRNGRGQESTILFKQTTQLKQTTQQKSPVSLFLRLSIKATTPEQLSLLKSGQLAFIPEPTYGTQLQTFAYPGGRAEGKLSVSYTPLNIVLPDESVTLYQPSYSVSQLGYGPMHDEVLFSPRLTPPMIGLGLLEAIDDQSISALADPDDRNQDGISGKLNQVWDAENQKIAIGRFGWKASKKNLAQQNAAALNGDLGISSTISPNPAGDCTPKQIACYEQRHGSSDIHDGLEASQTMTDLLLYFTRYIAVPPRRDIAKPAVLKGKEHFYSAGCTDCHTPKFITSETAAPSHLAGQAIWPYTDLLLHDMGEGLADNRTEYLANGSEWRTPPLWGIGLTKTVGGAEFFLHDGRARSLLEAILWHGGEAEKSKQFVKNLTKLERDNLIIFLESL